MYQEENMHSLSQPVLLYFKEPFKGSLKKGSDYNRYCDLEVIGNSKSIAEATLIQTAKMILAEEGYKNIGVEINSIGDKDSIARFGRDLTNYYRKHINDMHAECRQLLKKDPFELLCCQNEKCRKINEGAPRSMNFLSESSRNHFKEVLEYLEALQIPYKINNHLIGNRKYCTETIFSITNLDYDKKTDDHKILAVGVRYDGLAKKINMKREVQGVGISLLIKGNHQDLRKDIKKVKKPFASFVQLGFESKLLSLSIIENLRQVKVPLCLSLAKDRLGAQVSIVEKSHIPYSFIMGKKEAIEKTVIVRNIESHAQDIVPIDELAGYIKKLER
jgi:histidyl-tRNA synthetase